jgi:hypothetical protein
VGLVGDGKYALQIGYEHFLRLNEMDPLNNYAYRLLNNHAAVLEEMRRNGGLILKK